MGRNGIGERVECFTSNLAEERILGGFGISLCFGVIFGEFIWLGWGGGWIGGFRKK